MLTLLARGMAWPMASALLYNYSHTVACYSNGSMADYWGGMPFCLCVYLCVCVSVCSLSPPTVFMVGQPFFVCKTCIPRRSSRDKLECKIYFIFSVISPKRNNQSGDKKMNNWSAHCFLLASILKGHQVTTWPVHQVRVAGRWVC